MNWKYRAFWHFQLKTLDSKETWPKGNRKSHYDLLKHWILLIIGLTNASLKRGDGIHGFYFNLSSILAGFFEEKCKFTSRKSQKVLLPFWGSKRNNRFYKYLWACILAEFWCFGDQNKFACTYHYSSFYKFLSKKY